MAKPEIDPATGVQTTGHSWDGIKELDNPLPKWWVGTYIICIIFAAAYVWLYPAIPTGTDASKGSLGYSQRIVVEEEIAAAKEAQGQYFKQIVETPIAEISADPDLTRFAMRGGQAAFNTNCAGCHGVGGGGQEGGYPVLADDDWLWGGDVEAIYTTIEHGVRSASDDARFSEMPNFGGDGLLDKDQISDLAKYVVDLAEGGSDASSPAGVLFEENCASCHGNAGEGMMDLGAPNLRDFVWLYGGTQDMIASQIAKPKHGVMPAFGPRLDNATLRMLAVYVHGLGGGL